MRKLRLELAEEVDEERNRNFGRMPDGHTDVCHSEQKQPDHDEEDDQSAYGPTQRVGESSDMALRLSARRRPSPSVPARSDLGYTPRGNDALGRITRLQDR